MNQNSSQQEFLKLIEQHRGILIKICSLYARLPEEREDLFQEIIVQLWKAWPSFKNLSKFSTWMYRIALNTSISGLRKKKAELVYMDHLQLPERLPEDDATRKEQLSSLYKAIRELPEIDRAVVVLYLEDNSYEDMEEILGISQGTLRVKMTRIKEKLKRTIQTFEYGT
ncbi:MAG TPA: sigma-70 family RNA polymerase sigma factor [Chitinophagaceae bacterium]|nr:sigma-70 family RNA polymerase sigma factor [Chitinophagaceae bacterium]